MNGRSATDDPKRSSGVRATFVAAGMSTSGVLPVFLLGGMAVLLREDIAFGERALGQCVAMFFLASALTSIPGGHLGERFGVRPAVVVATALSAAGLLGVGFVATSLTHLLVCMVLAGVGNGVAQPTSNLVLARGVMFGRQGLAFGIKQAAIPGATLIVGGAVGLLASLVGWRWAYGGWALLALVVALSAPPGLERVGPARAKGHTRDGDVKLRPMLVLAFAAGIGAAVGTSLASFFVDSVVSGGLTPSVAGMVLTAASIMGIVSRLVIGLVADRLMGGHFRLVLRLSAIGSLGFLGLAFGGRTWLIVASAFLAFAAGWGWPGLFNYAVVRWNRNAPGVATSITQAGVFVGGVVGPLTFGEVAARWSFTAAWTGAALLSVFCAGVVQWGRRALVADRDARTATSPLGGPDADFGK